MTDNQGGKISQTPATLAIRRRYLWFLTLHHDCECTVKTARHIWNFNHTLRSGSHELCIETLLKLIQAQGGADHVQSWREIAKKLGFEPNKATSVTFRLKKWVYENHIHEFLEKEVNSSRSFLTYYALSHQTVSPKLSIRIEPRQCKMEYALPTPVDENEIVYKKPTIPFVPPSPVEDPRSLRSLESTMDSNCLGLFQSQY